MQPVEHIESYATPEGGGNVILATIIRGLSGCTAEGVTFFTQPEANLQVGYIKHAQGVQVPEHYHMRRRQVGDDGGMIEVLFVRRGQLRVDLYQINPLGVPALLPVCSRTLGPGDLIILMEGGHGFQAVTDVEILEVRTGPYLGCKDKTRPAQGHDPITMERVAKEG